MKDSPEYRKQLLKEYRTENSDDPNQFSRRSFLSIMGASIALAGLAGCRRPVEKIVPFVKQDEEVIPGVAQYYATTMPLGNSAYGMIVESHEGRPTKIEGNPKHPSSKGASNLLMQAAILNLYDPDRSDKVRHKGKEKKLEDFRTFWKEQLKKFTAIKGEGLAVFSEAFSSSTLEKQKKEFHKIFPKATWLAYESINDNNSLIAIKKLTGQSLRPLYHYDKADVILSLDADFLQYESESLTAARGFAEGRKISSPDDKMNRLYVVESGYSITGAAADHRIKLKSSEIGGFLWALAEELKSRSIKIKFPEPKSDFNFDSRWLSAVADDLVEAKGRSLIVVGRRQHGLVHTLAIAVNEALNNINKTVTFIEDNESVYPQKRSMFALRRAETIIILGGNPVYNMRSNYNSPLLKIYNRLSKGMKSIYGEYYDDSVRLPSEYDLPEIIDRTDNTIHISEYYDETSQLCDWHIPRAHFLESWGDARAIDGTLSVIQPMIAPLFNGISDIEFMEIVNSGESKTGYELVRDNWRNIIKGDLEKGWRKVLHDGFLERSASNLVTANIDTRKLSSSAYNLHITEFQEKTELVFKPSLLYDGRFANNGWLQELPDPITKLVWDNAALLSVKTAETNALENGDVVSLKIDIEDESKELEVPVWIVPGMADDSIHLPLGYGRLNVGRIANNIGFNAYRLMGSDNILNSGTVSLTKTGKKHEFANTQDHNRMEGRAIVREATFDEYKKNPEFAGEMVEHPPLKSIFPDYDYSKGYQWGMVIDLNACIGCGICTLACQSENNIPIVGKEQAGNGREMHWMRNDRYFNGDEHNPEIVIMPVTCQHCENAPCEQVCPVAATTHDEEGLNNMTYNRCIGTRYCSNNCPYKVRRFNFFNYSKELPEVMKMAQNPDVTVRSRGVMEKCTFCLQRIKRVKRSAKKQGREMHDGELVTACQQACPTGAIIFGNINDPKSVVALQKKINRNYELLAEFNIRPRNSYLAKVRNINEKLAMASSDKDVH